MDEPFYAALRERGIPAENLTRMVQDKVTTHFHTHFKLETIFTCTIGWIEFLVGYFAPGRNHFAYGEDKKFHVLMQKSACILLIPQFRKNKEMNQI